MLSLSVAAASQAASLVDDVRLIADSTTAALAAPAPQTFTVTQAGTYTLKLTDLQTPANLTELSVALANSAATAATLDSPGGTKTVDVQLAVGTYTVQPLATTMDGSAGSFSVSVSPQGSATPLFLNQWAVAASAAPAPVGQSTFSAHFSVTDAGSYQVTVTDRNFPAALGGVQLLLAAGSTPLCTAALAAGTASCSATLAADSSYDVFVIAQSAAPGYAGLYSLKVVGGSAGSTTAYASTQAVGTLAQPLNLVVPATESVTLQVSDLGFPAPLVGVRALVAQGGEVLQQFASAGSSSFPVGAGTAKVFSVAQPDPTAGEGALAIYASDAAGPLLDMALPEVGAGHYGFAFSKLLDTAGTYQFSITDFQLPSPLATLHAVVEQRGAAVGSGTTATLNGAQPGALNMLGFATTGGPSASGLFGIDLSGPGSAGTIYEITQGVGAAFRSTTVDIVASGGSYVAKLADLGFPADFSQVWLIGTRGQSVVAQIVGAGKVVFDVPSAGTYVINVLAQVGVGQHYGSYGFNLSAAPPAPTVTLTSNVGTVNSGGTVTLTWSSTDATGCNASDGWSGMLATAGSQASSALSASATFTLTCTGDGGTGSASTQVQVTQPPASGGGAFDGASVWILVLSAAAALRRRMSAVSPLQAT